MGTELDRVMQQYTAPVNIGYEFDKIARQYGLTSPSAPAAATPVAATPVAAAPVAATPVAAATAQLPQALQNRLNLEAGVLPKTYTDPNLAGMISAIPSPALQNRLNLEAGILPKTYTDPNLAGMTSAISSPALQNRLNLEAGVLPKAYAEGGPVSASEPGSLPALIEQYGVGGGGIAEARARARDENEKFGQMLEGSLASPEQNRAAEAEKYFRLAAAFGAPTKTGAFSENLSLAAQQMADHSAGQRESEMNKVKLRLEAQRYKSAVAKQDLDAAIESENSLRDLEWKQKQYELQERKWGQSLGLQQAELAERERHNRALETERAAASAAKAGGTPAGPEARQNLSDTIGLIRGQYDVLKQNKAIAARGMSTLETGWAGLTSSTPMQAFARVAGDESQRARDAIFGLRSQLIGDVMKASGMKATQLNSIIELQTFLQGMGNPSVSYETNMMLLKNLDKRYGVKGAVAPAAATPQAASPAAAPAAAKVVDFNSLK